MPNLTRSEIENLARGTLAKAGTAGSDAEAAAFACGFLEAVGYPGLSLLAEAIAETDAAQRAIALNPEYGLLDTQNVSCVFLAPRLVELVKAQGRIVLMQVRHGLYLVPFSVREQLAIGCPVDPSFALGGVRERNPYEEKLARAEAMGIDVAEDVIHRLEALSA